MAWETGTATDYKNLLLKLKDFLTTNATLVAAGQAWEVLSYDNTSAEHTLMLKGKGLAGQDSVYCGITTETLSGIDAYNWKLVGLTGYIPGNGILAQPGACAPSGYMPRILMMNAAMKYWFIANGRYFSVAVKVSTVYEFALLGLLDPYAPPLAYPYPMFVGGSFSMSSDPSVDSGQTRWSDTTTRHSTFLWGGLADTNSSYGNIDVQVASHGYMWSGGTWLPVNQVSNYAGGYTNEQSKSRLRPNKIQIAPFCYQLRYGGDHASRKAEYGTGAYTLFPAVVMMPNPTPAVIGELPGVFCLQGTGLTAEDTILVNGVTHLVLPNTFRSTQNSYFAVRLEV